MDENNKFGEEMTPAGIPNGMDEDWNKMLQADAQIRQQPAAEEPAKAVKSKKPFIIGGIAVAVLAIAAVVIVLLSGSPLSIVAKGAGNTADALAANPVPVFMEKLGSGGSVETVIDLSEMDLGVSLDGSINAKFYTDLEKQGTAVSFSAVLEDMTLLDMLVVMEDREIALSSGVLLGEESYGVDLEQASRKFDDSIFGHEGAYSLGIESLDQYLNGTADNRKLNDEFGKMMADALVDLSECISEHSRTDKESAVLDFDGESVKTKAVLLAVDEEGAVQIIMETLNYLRNDAELKEFLYANPMYAASLMQMLDPYSVDIYDFAEEDIDAALDELYAQLDELAADEEGLREVMAGFDMELIFHVSKSDKYLIGVEGCVRLGEDEYEFEILAGPDMENISLLSFELGDGESISRLTYDVEICDKERYSSALRVQQDGETVVSGSFDWNKATGEFELTVDADGDTYGAEGNLSYSEQEIVIAVQQLSIAGRSELVGIDLILKGSDKMPGLPEYVELLDMSQAEFEELIGEVELAVQELAMLFYGMPSMYY